MLLAAGTARAASGVAVKVGAASFAGDLSQDKAQPMAGALAVLYPGPDSWAHVDRLGGLELRAMLDVERTATKNLRVSMGGADVLACALADLPLQFCPYAGAGAVVLSQDGERAVAPSRSYGALVPFKIDDLYHGYGVVAGGQLNFYGASAKLQGRTARMDEGTLSAFLGTSF
jgi:hypothetical protein